VDRLRRTNLIRIAGACFALLGAVLFVAVTLLALPLVDGYDNPGSIWPGALTLISAQAFSVFCGSLGISAAFALVVGGAEPLREYARAGLVLNVVILVAAFVYIGRFDFGAHPGGLLDVGLYGAVLVSTLFLLPSLRTPAGVVGEAEPAAG
jgi:hypothetical protein